MLTTHKRKNRKGVTLIEALFVLGIAAILLGIVMVVLSTTSSRQKTIEAKQELLEVIQAASALASGTSDFSDTTTDTLKKSGLLPAKYFSSTGGEATISTPLGGDIVFYNYSASGVLPGQSDPGVILNVWIFNLSKQACVDFAETDFTGNSGNMNVNWVYDSGGKAYPPSIAVRACQPGNQNYIGFNFTKTQ